MTLLRLLREVAQQDRQAREGCAAGALPTSTPTLVSASGHRLLRPLQRNHCRATIAIADLSSTASTAPSLGGWARTSSPVQRSPNPSSLYVTRGESSRRAHSTGAIGGRALTCCRDRRMRDTAAACALHQGGTRPHTLFVPLRHLTSSPARCQQVTLVIVIGCASALSTFASQAFGAEHYTMLGLWLQVRRCAADTLAWIISFLLKPRIRSPASLSLIPHPQGLACGAHFD